MTTPAETPLTKPLTRPLPSFDAVEWAKAFCDSAERTTGTRPDKGWMITWFANALHQGYNEGRRAAKEPAAGSNPADSLPSPAEAVDQLVKDARECIGRTAGDGSLSGGLAAWLEGAIRREFSAVLARIETTELANFRLRERQRDLESSTEASKWDELEAIRRSVANDEATPQENFGFLLGQIERLLCKLATSEAQLVQRTAERDDRECILPELT